MRGPASLLDRAAGPAVLGLVAAAAGLGDRLVGPPSERHALLVAALVAAAGLATWRLADRWDLAWLAAATAGLWALPHGTPRARLWLAVVPLAALAVPPDAVARVPDAVLAVAGAILAAGAALALGLGATGTGIAAASALALALARPDVPTEATLRALRTGALVGPGVALLVLAGLNAGTGWLEAPDAAAALGLGVGLAGLLALAGLAALGLATLLESAAPAQRVAWLAAALAAALALGALPTREPAAIRAGLAVSLGPAVALASLAAARLDATGVPRPAAFALPAVAASVQFALV